MRAGIKDLNFHLFEQLERLNDDQLMQKNGKEEIERSRAIVGISKEIINLGELELHAEELKLTFNVKKLNSTFLDG